MHNPYNPFILGHRIRRPYFCDRIEEEKRLISAVMNGRNVVMISPRRMGKTSLIYVSLHDSERFEENYITFFLDILQTSSLGEFTFLLGKAIFEKLASRSDTTLRGFLSALKSLTGSFGFDPITGSPTFNIQLGDIKNPEYTLEEIFSYIEKSDKNVIITIDEFQQITKYPEKNTEALLRSHIQKLSNATFIFAGSESTLLQEMFVSSKRPFYNSAELLHLGPIEEKIYIDFAADLFLERGKRIEPESISWIYRLFEGNTFYMQRALNGAFAETADHGTCDMDCLKRSVKEMLASNDVIYREILSNISVPQKSILYAIAQERRVESPTSGKFIKQYSLPSASSVQSALTKLIRTGVISRFSDGYSLSDPLFRIFINQLHSVHEL